MVEGSGPIAQQRINKTTTVKLANGNKKELLPGTFVKAIRKDYVPRNHVFSDYDDSKFILIHSPYGLGLIEYGFLDWQVF